MVDFILPSFAKGELGPQLYGRTDTAAYQVGLKIARNLIIHPAGGAMNRPGLPFIGPCKDHSYDPRLWPFRFKVQDTYVLEFGNLYLRVIRNGAHVLEPAVTVTNVSQANPGLVTATAHGFSNNDEVYFAGIVGMTRLNTNRYRVINAATNTFELGDQVDGTPINTAGAGYSAYVSGGTVARVYTLVTPYLVADLPVLKFVQNKDTITITHAGYGTRRLTRSGHAAWTLSQPTFAPTIAAPVGLALTDNTSGSTAYKYQITATAANTGEESLPALNSTTKTVSGASQTNPVAITATSHGFLAGEEIELDAIIGMTELNGRRFIVSSPTTNAFNLTNSDGSTEDGRLYNAYTSGGTANLTFVKTAVGNATANETISWTALVGATSYSVYKQANGVFGFIGTAGSNSFTDTNLAPDLQTTPPSARNPFRTPGTQPGTSGYFEQRQVYGGSTNQPDTEFFSQVGNQLNFSVSSPAQDDDAITATMNSTQANEIRHFLPGTDLIVFTSGSEWRVNAGGGNALTPSTLLQKPQSDWGSSHIQPYKIGIVILFVPENRVTVRTLQYNLYTDTYQGQDLMQLAPHIFEDYYMVQWTYARTPQPLMVSVRSDGKAPVLTYDQDNQVIAWGSWDTQGKFTAVTSVRSVSTDVDDTVFFVVKRRINGRTVRYIEATASRRFTDVRNCNFIDSSLTFDNPVAISNISLGTPPVNTTAKSNLITGDGVTANSAVQLNANTAVTNGVSYTMSCWLRAGTATEVFLADAGDLGALASFNLVGAGTVAVQSGNCTAATITAYLNGWYRCTATGIPVNGLWNTAAGSPTYAHAANASTFSAWGMQLEQSAVATTYQSTGAIPAGANLVLWSEDMTQGTWNKSGVSAALSSAAAAPNMPPITITSAAHGLANGVTIDLSDIVWGTTFDASFNETMPEQLTGRYTVQNVQTNTFGIRDLDNNSVDGTLYTPYIEGGNFRVPATTFIGCDHLEGMSCVALCDGNVVDPITITNGSFTTNRPYSRVRVGLRYISDLKTLSIETPGRDSGQPKFNKISYATVRFYKSRGLLIGPNENMLTEMKQREDEDMGDPTDLLTGDKKITLEPTWGTDCQLFLRQKDPLPMHILAIMPNIEPGDEL